MKSRRFTQAKAFRFKAVLSAAAAALLLATGAQAVTAGSVIQNQAVIDYAIAGVSGRSVESNVSNVTVDRALAVVVQSDEVGTVDVFPGKQNAVLRFTVTNMSNATVDVLLAAASAVGYTDANDVNTPSDLSLDNTIFQVYVDDGDGLYEPTSDVARHVDNLARGDSVVVYVVADIPAEISVGELAAINLIAQVAEPDGQNVAGDAITQDDSGRASPAGVFESGEMTQPQETASVSKNDNLDRVLDVFIDGGGLASEDYSTAQVQDVPFNGQHTDTGAFVAIALPLELTKSAEIIDPDGGSEPYEGATIRYTLNLRTLTDAQNVVISDAVPEGTTYVPGTLTFEQRALTDSADDDIGDFNQTQANTITVDLGSVPQSMTYQVSFDVTIN